jgi:hypothetical protein
LSRHDPIDVGWEVELAPGVVEDPTGRDPVVQDLVLVVEEGMGIGVNPYASGGGQETGLWYF